MLLDDITCVIAFSMQSAPALQASVSQSLENYLLNKYFNIFIWENPVLQ